MEWRTSVTSHEVKTCGGVAPVLGLTSSSMRIYPLCLVLRSQGWARFDFARVKASWKETQDPLRLHNTKEGIQSWRSEVSRNDRQTFGRTESHWRQRLLLTGSSSR